MTYDLQNELPRMVWLLEQPTQRPGLASGKVGLLDLADGRLHGFYWWM